MVTHTYFKLYPINYLQGLAQNLIGHFKQVLYIISSPPPLKNEHLRNLDQPTEDVLFQRMSADQVKKRRIVFWKISVSLLVCQTIHVLELIICSQKEV